MNILERILGNNGTGDQQHDDGGMPVIERPPVETPDNKITPAKPPMYSVVLHNDHTTFPDFVVQVLQQAFSVEGAAAQKIMMTAHRGGQAVVKVTTKALAESQLDTANAIIQGAEPGRNHGNRNGGCELTFSIKAESDGDK